MDRKTFTRDQAVEVVPDALGDRGARPGDWTRATYVEADSSKPRAWHFVMIGHVRRLVPPRRIREIKVARPRG
jgi:hypothetical protein